MKQNGPDHWQAHLPWPGRETHKYGRGALGVLAGGAASSGAARLAALAGLRSGAGAVSLLCRPSAVLVNAAQLTEIMIRRWSDPDDLAPVLTAGKMDTVIAGPGAGVAEETRAVVFALLAAADRAVLDADALTSFEHDPEALFAAIHERCVLTPHEGEFARLFGPVGKDREAAVASAAARAGAVVLLKGARTLIAAPDGTIIANDHASPWLATAGSGDVLAGIIGGLMAQGMPANQAAAAGAWIHGEAGRRSGPGTIAGDLIRELKSVFSELYERASP